MRPDLFRDTTYAVRSLRRTPAFTAIALATLALGIGANTAIFSVINSVLLRPLPYREAGRLVFLWSARGDTPEPLAPARFLDFREQLGSASALAAICQFSVTMGGAVPEQVDASSVSWNFFDLIGARPLLGEPFHAGSADDSAVVIGHALWTRRFGASPDIVGRPVTINGRSRRIVAVMGRDFLWPAVTALPGNAGGPELWLPPAARDVPRTPADDPSEDLSGNRQIGILRVVARLRDGVAIEAAQREAEVIAARLAEAHPVTDGGRSATLVPLRSQFFGPVTRPLGVLVGAVAVVLAIACANVASLLLGRATVRRREIAVRLALGASRGRVVRQLLTEAVVLSTAGAAGGVLLAWAASRWIVSMSPGGLPRVDDAGLDAVVLAFSLLSALVTGLAFGAAPAWQVSRTAPGQHLADGGVRGASSAPGRRTREVLVVAEIAVALVLLVGAGLLLRSFHALASVDTGIAAAKLLTFELRAPAQDGARRVQFYTSVLERLRAQPGVVAAGAAVTLPIGGDTFSTRYLVDGAPLPVAGAEPSAGYQIVTPGYFDTLGTPVRAGRDVREADGADAPLVVLVNDTLARQAWPDRHPVGRRVRFGRGADAPWHTVIGVVADVRHTGPSAPPRPEIYQPLAQRPFGSMAFVVRTSTDPAALVPLVRRAIADLAPGLALAKVATMDEHVERALSRPRFLSTLVAAFGALALALALVGIYGVMSYAVTERRQEIAIRMALGAQRGAILRMVLRRATLLSALGVTGGIAAAWAMTGIVSGLLFGIQPTDVPTFAAASLGLAMVSIMVAALPAWRASRNTAESLLRS
jgi:putative ABC transport system permease protein